ncbi:MAG: hypothetical protein AB7I30_21720 [Isosphaeraceae bacterium]
MTQPDRLVNRRWPGGLLGALALCLVVEIGVGRLADDRFTTVGAAAWSHASTSARRATSRGNLGIVGFGDSLVKHGVLPAVLERRLGRPSINLAMPWGQAPAHDVLLRRILRDGGRPDALLVDGEMLGDDPAERIRVWPELLNVFECAELALTAGDSRLLGMLTLGGLSPSFRVRADLRAGALAFLTGRTLPDAQEVLVHRRNWRRNLGAEPLPMVHSSIGPDPRGAVSSERWSCHPVNAVYVERFLERSKARAIPVFWLLPPYHPGVQRLRERNGRDAAYEAFVRALAARHPHVVVVDARRAGYPARAMADLTHLNREGALVFSAALADVIAARLAETGPGASPRWVDLPSWGEHVPTEVGDAVAVEDLRESARAFARR